MERLQSAAPQECLLRVTPGMLIAGTSNPFRPRLQTYRGVAANRRFGPAPDTIASGTGAPRSMKMGTIRSLCPMIACLPIGARGGLGRTAAGRNSNDDRSSLGTRAVG
jgi:hypothetical protein